MFDLLVNNKRFAGWAQASLSRSIDANCGQFSLMTSAPKNFEQFPITAGSKVVLSIDGDVKLTGFVDRIEFDGDTRSLTVQGRDSTSDIIDSSIPDEAKFIDESITLSGLCEKLISALGANIKVKTHNFEDPPIEHLTNAAVGDKAINFLVSFARKVQIYIVSDGHGNLVLFRPSDNVIGDINLDLDGTTNNVKRYTIFQDYSDRFNANKIVTQPSLIFGIPFGESNDAIAIDDKIRTSRYFEMQSEESMEADAANNRAIEEMNLRRSNSVGYSVVVPSSRSNRGIPWDFGNLVKISDKISGTSGLMMIKSCSFSHTMDAGFETTLTLVAPEAYSARDKTESDKRNIEIAGGNLE